MHFFFRARSSHFLRMVQYVLLVERMFGSFILFYSVFLCVSSDRERASGTGDDWWAYSIGCKS